VHDVDRKPAESEALLALTYATGDSGLTYT